MICSFFSNFAQNFKQTIMSTSVYLLLGSNKGDRTEYLKSAIDNLKDLGVRVKRTSKIYQAESWGYADADYLNLVAEADVTCNPSVLLEMCHVVEAELGRVRSGKGYSARTIDIDILYYGNDLVDKPNLIIPHRLLQNRKFVLMPLCDLIPDFVHPVLNKTNTQLLAECQDQCRVDFFADNL